MKSLTLEFNINKRDLHLGWISFKKQRVDHLSGITPVGNNGYKDVYLITRNIEFRILNFWITLKIRNTKFIKGDLYRSGVEPKSELDLKSTFWGKCEPSKNCGLVGEVLSDEPTPHVYDLRDKQGIIDHYRKQNMIK